MGSVIGEILPLGLAVALGPAPIIGVVLILLSPNASTFSLMFVIGWIVGIGMLIAVGVGLASILPENDPDESAPVSGTIKLILGTALVLLAYRQWSKRPSDGSELEQPGWMESVNTMTPTRALGFGFLLSGLNPKHFLLAGAAGVTIGASELSGNEELIAGLLFVLLASLTVIIPTIAYRVSGPKMDASLNRIRGWLIEHNTALMAGMTLLIGVVVIGRWIGNF